MYFDQLIEDAEALRDKCDKLYIYGAGFYGQDVCRTLIHHGIGVDGFLVTKDTSNKTALGLPVILAETALKENIGVVVGLSDTYVGQVLAYLTESGMDMTRVINGGKYITGAGGRLDMRNSKLLEVSTVMGCTVNCKFCPQDVLIKRYFQENKSRQRVMTLENFKLILEHTPKDCIIDFSGMVEPFNNPDCLEMIQMACDADRKVYLFTTLAGVEEETVDQLIKLPLFYVTLHVADKRGYAHIPTTEAYYRNIEKVVNARKKDGAPFVDFINAQTDPDDRIAEIVKGKYEVMCSVQDRAGNITVKGSQHRERVIGPEEKIKCCFCGDDLSNNVVLPDGTMLICNMDYEMNHVLGNLYEEDYDAIRSKGEHQRVLRALKCEEHMEKLLCRSCLLARVEE